MSANLDRLRNTKNDRALQEFARVYVAQALRRHLPEVVAVSVVAVRSARTLDLAVTCARADDPAAAFAVALSIPR